MSKKVLDLFSGIGGFSLGLEKAGFETVAFCEIDPYAQKVLSKHWPKVPIYENIKTITSIGVPVDVICGGFPCQDISIAGKGTGITGEKSGLWFEFHRLIDELRPKFAIIENVFALRSRGLEVVLQNLASIGYDATWTTFDSQFFGVPQRRRRVYILAVRDGIKKNTDIFDNLERSNSVLRKQIQYFKELRKRDFKASDGIWKGSSFFTRQRSDEFAATGLSSTLAKRDYKSFTDLIVMPDGSIRRVTPKERLLLQGFPKDWFEGLNIPLNEQYKLNGMTVSVVEHIGNKINEAFCI